MDPSLAEVLLAHKENSFYKEDSDFVFGNPDGKTEWRDSILGRQLKPAAKKAEIGKIGWHTFQCIYARATSYLGTLKTSLWNWYKKTGPLSVRNPSCFRW